MAARLAGERQIARRAALEDPQRLLDMHAAHQQIDAEVAAKRDRAQFGLARRRHDFHPRGCPGGANGGGQATEHRRLGADVLEADMAQPQFARDLDQVERVLDRRVVARQHEDEVHSL